ncbi:carboxypeptidase-like regulatory domain-containing protein [Bathymodiolus platifrons methanotrophic gill symbiont]|uniref:carboxypeptidase-like regulatory domain-containing protein n=1 Tax=Bathymodiolus platifrons methanotrophic gill symbiont TaxID=113268 RepID=UPI001124FD9D|nr:carboxypeptidase-like regulatory domain-containing protein [Bathymodiolus platifrons methanotrophic gill symbiont]
MAEVKSSLLDLPVLDQSEMLEEFALDEKEFGLNGHVRERMKELLVGIKILLNYLPQQLCAFNYPIFQAQYQAIINDLIEYQFILPLMIESYSKFNRKINIAEKFDLRYAAVDVMDEYIQQQISVFQQFIKSNLHSCLATIFYHYEAVRRLNGNWFRRFSQSHQGIEPLFSVPKGGTFILLYEQGNRVVADFSLANCISCCCEVPEEPVCLPPVATADYLSVTLENGNDLKKESYKPVQLIINVIKNDYSLLNSSAAKLSIKLEEANSELGGVISIKKGKINYQNNNPVPGMVDRFTYVLEESSNACNESSIGDVSIFFIPPVEETKLGGIRGKTRLREGEYVVSVNNATVTIIETGQSVMSGRGDTEINGYFEFLNLPYATYSITATYGRGVSEPVLVVVDGTNFPVILEVPVWHYWGVVNDKGWITRVVESTGLSKEKAKGKLESILKEHRENQLEVAIKASKSESVKASAAYKLAQKFITESVAFKDDSVETLAEEYADLSTKLIGAIEKAAAEDQQHYLDLLKSASFAYMDRLYFTEEGSLNPEKEREIKIISKNIKKAGMDITIVKEEWGGKLRDDLKLTSVATVMTKLQ